MTGMLDDNVTAEVSLDPQNVRLKDAPGEAFRVLKLTAIDSEGMVNLPIDPVEIGKRLGIDMHATAMPNSVAGAISKEAGSRRATAVANENDNWKRQRFTLAHEIGHFVKHVRTTGPDSAVGFVENRDEMSSRGKDPEEIFANQFAASLLMPSGAVRDMFDRGLSVKSLADVFGVSKDAMEFRLKNLGLVVD